MKPWLKMLALFVLIVIIVGGVWGYKTYSFITKMQAQGTPKMVVSTIKADKSTWQGAINSVGSMGAQNGADLAFEASGVIDKIYVQHSSPIKKGAVIATLKMDEELAQLSALKATADLAEANYQRDLAQFNEGAISQSQLGQSKATQLTSKAAFEEMQARINKKTLRAPFDGHLGIVAYSVGAWVNAGARVVALNNLQTLYADFSLPQNLLAKAKIGDRVDVFSEAFPLENFSGKITSIDSRLDADTRTIMVRATIANEQEKLMPGLMARVMVQERGEQSWITLPQTTVVYSPYGNSVYKIATAQKLYEANINKAKKSGADEKALAKIEKPAHAEAIVVQQVFVETGLRRGNQIAILSGLELGDEVVTAGQLKLKNGTEVEINNKVQPSNEAKPSIKPQE